MSAPQLPQMKSNSRGRGSVMSRDFGLGNRGRQRGRLSPYNTTRGADSQLLKLPSSKDHHHSQLGTKPTKHAPLAAAIQSHAGKLLDPQLEKWRKPGVLDSRTYKDRMLDYYQTLKQNRERERKNAIKDGFLADPDKPTSLANAITPVGTCQDMCPEFERVERIVQFMVEPNEKILSPSSPDTKLPCEALMVKRFRRSAAGYDEQLPSDIRPPPILQNTLDYLINEVVGGLEPLANVHKFVWDRTRGIRNDFSIQQVTKTEDLKIAIDCFERIARFHILSLHQLSQLQSDKGEFDPHQEREQLNNTLLSLMYYYDDSRHKLTSPNEAEFRAYCIIFEIQDQRPDLEDRAQNWPRSILEDPRVQTAFRLYAAAGNTADDQGPLRPRTQFATAQANTGGFWTLVKSNAVSYLMACVAEIYFNLVRRTALEAIWKAYKGKRGGPMKMEDWTIKELTSALGFDTQNQTEVFCEEHDFQLAEREDGELFVDLGSVMSGGLIDQNPRRKQNFSRVLAEIKRLGRTLPAVINGLSASQAQAQGLVEDMTDAENGSVANSEPLFIDGSSEDKGSESRSKPRSPQKQINTNGGAPKLNPTATALNPFAPSTVSNSSKSNPFKTTSIFGKPTPKFPSNQFLKSATAPETPNSTLSSQPSSATVIDLNPQPTASTADSGIPLASNFDFYDAANKSTGQGSNDDRHTLDNQKSTSPIPLKSTAQFKDAAGRTTGFPFGPTDRGASGVFDQSYALFPETTPFHSLSKTTREPTKCPPTITKSSQPEKVFEGPPNSAARNNFSFATSHLFQSPTKTLNDKNTRDQTHDASSDSEDSNTATTAVQRTDVMLLRPLSSIRPNGTTSKVFTPLGPNLQTFSTPSPPSNVNIRAISSTTTPTLPLTLTSISTFPPNSVTKLLNGLPKPPNDTSLSQSPFIPSSVEKKRTQESQPMFPSNMPTMPALTPFKPISTRSFLAPAAKDTHVKSQALILDDVATAVMLDDNGLLQQFIEYTVKPLIESTVAQLQDERSWEEARQFRTVLLSKKYFGRWRLNAWNLGIKRKGRDRRRNFAKSIHSSVINPPLLHLNTSTPLRPVSSGNTLTANNSPTGLTLPSSELPRKRLSLSADLGHEKRALAVTSGMKYKQVDLTPSKDELGPRPTKVHHRRSQTLGNPISASQLRTSRPSHRSRMYMPKIPEGSIHHEILMKQARKLLPRTVSGATRTDYFRLKALGVNPDTPIVPLAKKRDWDTVQENGDIRSSKSPPLPHIPSTFAKSTIASQTPSQKSGTKSEPLSAEDEDEALFAQLRSVREALAESQQWMRSERQSMERSTTPQRPVQKYQNQSQTSTAYSPVSDNDETPAKRRLREIKERGHTPSRTEVRLRAMGDKALLPKGFWDGEGMGRSLTGKLKQDVVVIDDQARDEELMTRIVNGRVSMQREEWDVLNSDEDQDNEGEFEREDQFDGDYDEEDEEGDVEEVYDEDDEEEDEEEEDDDEQEQEHFAEQSASRCIGFAALNGQRQGFGNGQLSPQRRVVDDWDKTGTSAENAIEL